MRTGKAGFNDLHKLAIVGLGFSVLMLMIILDGLEDRASRKQHQTTAIELQAKLEKMARLKCPTEAQKLLILEPLDPPAQHPCERTYQTLMEGDAVPVARCIADDRKFTQGTSLCVVPNLSLNAPPSWEVMVALLPQNGRGH